MNKIDEFISTQIYIFFLFIINILPRKIMNKIFLTTSEKNLKYLKIILMRTLCDLKDI